MKPLIIDNFVDQDSFQMLQKTMFDLSFHWSYNSVIDYEDDKDKFQFTHNFYDQKTGGSSSIFYNDRFFNNILKKVGSKEIFRIKANLLTKTPEIVPNRFHTDIQGNWGVIPYITSILYMNTNNGYTEFEDGTKVESVANRFISFPMDMKHRGTSCTDEKIRVVINFNYLT